MIPDGWTRESLINVAEIRTGVAKGKKNLKYPVSVPYLRVANVQDGRIDLREIKSIEIERDKLSRYALSDGDVLMTEGGDFDKLGRGDVWRGQISPCITQNHVFVVRVNQNRMLPYFLSSLSGSNYGKSYFLGCAKKSTNLASINSTQLKEFPVLIPPLVEQAKIEEILSTWDQAIETTEKLIENSKAQKKALMQQLLTGKQRLPGFNDEWQEHRLEKLGATYGGLSGKSKNDFGKGHPYVPYLNIFRNSAVDPHTTNLVEISTNENQNAIQYGDILFTTSSETPEEVGMSSVILHHPPLTFLNSFCFGFRPHAPEALAPQFARFLFRGNEFRRNITRLAQGSTRFNLSKRYFLKVEVSLPPIDEQLKIARVLSLVEQGARIQYLQLADLRMEKKALMQQLLTGKRRVNVAAP